MHRIVITGGGTGGHIYPALAVYEKLKDDPTVEAILYIGARGHMEERLAAERNLQFVGLSSAGLPRRPSPELLSWPFKMTSAIADAKKAMENFRPTVVLGTGGYASAPPLAAALLMGVPYAVHEPDAHPGLVNRVMSRWAALCSLGMEGAKSRLTTSGTVMVNGNPVSSRLTSPPSRAEACVMFGLDEKVKTLLVTGGSQGAQAINEVIWKALPELLSFDPPMQILHQIGEKNFADYKAKLDASGPQDARYQIRPYIEDMAAAYAASDIALCRAGAMTISELAVSGTPAIFVPYPFAAQDHQTSNARYIESKNAAVVVVQDQLDRNRLIDLLRSLFRDRLRLGEMRKIMTSLGKPNSARDIADQLKELSEKQIKRSKKQPAMTA